MKYIKISFFILISILYYYNFKTSSNNPDKSSNFVLEVKKENETNDINVLISNNKTSKFIASGNEKNTFICNKCNFTNSKNDRYCLNCSEPHWDLSEKEMIESRQRDKVLSNQRKAKVTLLVEKEIKYNARRKLFGHYHSIYSKIKDATKITDISLKDVKLLVDGIEALYNFKVHYIFDQKVFFQSKNKISATGKQVNLSDMLNVFISLEDFFNSYPQKLIQKNLSAIYFVEDLTLRGKAPAGFASGKSFWISTRSNGRSFSKTQYLETIHHEFAHILHQNNTFPTKAWLNVNERDFKYVGQGWDMIGQGDTHEGGVERNKKGFLIKYNEASIEEDIAVYAEWLFTKEEKLIKKTQKYDRIRQKYNIITEYYKKLGVSFS